jgi:hypothetical protein
MARPWCKNYNGMSVKDTCDVGVKYDSLPKYGTKGFMKTCPCLGPFGGCDKAVYLTKEEMKAEDRMIRERLKRILKARAAIVEFIGPWKKGMVGRSGSIDCPICSGENTLKFDRSGYNGHIHARCKTENCVSWIE